MKKRERYVVYAVVVFLALIVGFLAWRLEGGGEVPSPDTGTVDGPIMAHEVPVSPGAVSEVIVEAIDRHLAGIDRRVANAVTGSWPDQAAISADAVSDVVVEAIDRQLTGIDRRVANAVYDKLQREGICGPADEKDDGCEGVPPAAPIGKNFTFLFDNAHLDPNRRITKDNKGVRLDGHHVARLDLIVKAFLACQRTDDPVSFHVAGYSSTAEFRVETETGSEMLLNSDDLNLETANLRMANVADYLKNRGFKVDNPPWDSIASLRRPYIDDFKPGVDQQALNRTVFLQITNAGRCDLDQLTPPPI